ncbi:MAG: DUF3365 domain-containing protein, partial [Myxococcota bacterium]
MPFKFSPMKIAAMLAVVWSIVIFVMFGWSYFIHHGHTIESAKLESLISYQKDTLFRKWATMHGGVYVPEDARTPPNQYLADIPERDIQTPSGRKLTLMNPAYMMRQLYEPIDADASLKGHITSLRPLRPENGPDEWERRALESFERGVKEVSSREIMDGKPFFRLMKPFYVEKGCLKCHASQGYREGEVRGGISVSVQMDPLLAIERQKILALLPIYLTLWFAGMAALVYGGFIFSRNEKRRAATEENLRRNRDELALAHSELETAHRDLGSRTSSLEKHTRNV